MSLDWVRQNRRQLVRSGVLRPVLRIELIEQALADNPQPAPSPEQRQGLLQRFWQQEQIPPPQRARWLAQRDLSEDDLLAILSRQQRWQQWCEQQWGERLQPLFLRHKNQLDQATASLLRLEDGGLARELYLQLLEEEASFEELSRRHCDDHPQRQGGQWGPKPLSGLPPALAELLRTTPVGQLRGPERIGPDDWVVLRLEAFSGSRLDDPDIPARLLQLEGEAWLTERIEAWLRRQAETAAASPIDQQPVDAAQQANGQI